MVFISTYLLSHGNNEQSDLLGLFASSLKVWFMFVVTLTVKVLHQRQSGKCSFRIVLCFLVHRDWWQCSKDLCYSCAVFPKLLEIQWQLSICQYLIKPVEALPAQIHICGKMNLGCILGLACTCPSMSLTYWTVANLRANSLLRFLLRVDRWNKYLNLTNNVMAATLIGSVNQRVSCERLLTGVIQSLHFYVHTLRECQQESHTCWGAVFMELINRIYYVDRGTIWGLC